MSNCLIAGLPDSGKSTYIGALWYVTQNDSDKGGLSLVASCDNLPENTQQLNTLSRTWVNVEDMDRTSSDIPNSISLILKKHGEEKEFEVHIPDFRGESIRSIVTKNHPKELDDWCEKANGLIYMISDIGRTIFEDDLGCDEDEDVDNNSEKLSQPPQLDPKNITPSTLNMILLKYIKEKLNTNKVVICLSAWDKIEQHWTNSPEEYLKEKSPALYNFICYHFPEVKFYGLSAQGGNYYEDDSRKVSKEFKKELQKKMLEGKRAYIYDGTEKSFDITKPIYNLVD